jgi:cytochrome subunit of sulfide dehydrogenase
MPVIWPPIAPIAMARRGALPSLAGLPAAGIALAMRDFRDGKRKATVMHQLAKGYTDAQIDAMAGYFAAQPAKK